MLRTTKPTEPAIPTKYQQVYELLLEHHSEAGQQAFVKSRWLDAVAGARRTMRWTQKWYRVAGAFSIGAAAVLPVLVTASTQADGVLRTVLGVLAVMTSLLVAASAGFLQAVNPGARWRLHRELRDNLEAEAWSLALRRGPYTGIETDAFDRFVDRVELIISEHSSQYRQEVAGVLSRPDSAGPDSGNRQG